MRNHVIWIPTYHCNYAGKCKYCNVWDLVATYTHTEDYRKWIELLNDIPPSVIDITGGEPTQYENFEEIVLNIQPKHHVGMTTNLSYPPSKYSKKFWNKFVSITFSFHPHVTDIDSFIEKVREVQGYRENKNPYTIAINIVGYPEFLDKIQSYIDSIKEKLKGVRPHVDPYIDDNYQYTEEEAEKVRKLRKYTGYKDTREIGYNLDDTADKICTAGQNHLLILPDGSVYSCMCGLLTKTDKYYMGNAFLLRKDIFSKTQKLCDISCSCGCDLDWTARRSIVHRQT